jgi:aminoglycoside phosphotransferase (APT) family kinase protein
MAEQANRLVQKATPQVEADAVAGPLLSHLQLALGEAGLTYLTPPVPIMGGFDTSIFAFELRGTPDAWAGPLILRVYRDGGQAQAQFETAAQNAVAAQGYPAPAMLHMCDDATVLGGAFAIMPRVPGVTMIDRIFSPALFRIAGLLAQAHAELHAIDVAAVRDALAAAGCDLAQRSTAADISATIDAIDAAQLDGLRRGLAWLTANRPGDGPIAVCHGDLHPLNVMMDGNDVSGVLDWANLRITDPMWDVGATVALMSQGPIELPGVIRPVVDFVRRRLVARYLKTYGAAHQINAASLDYYEAVRLFGFLLEVGTYRQSRAGIRPPSTKPTAFNDPSVVASIARRFKEITGVGLSLPPDAA